MDANLGRRFPSPTHPPTERHPPTPKARRNPPRLITYANEPRPLFDRFQQRPMGSRRIRCHIVINLDPEFRSKRNERKHHSISRPNSIEINRIAPPPPPPPPPPPVFFKNFTATKSRRHMAANAQSPWFFFCFFYIFIFVELFVELFFCAWSSACARVRVCRWWWPRNADGGLSRRRIVGAAARPPLHPPPTHPPRPRPPPRPHSPAPYPPPKNRPSKTKKKNRPTDRGKQKHISEKEGEESAFFLCFFFSFFFVC